MGPMAAAAAAGAAMALAGGIAGKAGEKQQQRRAQSNANQTMMYSIINAIQQQQEQKMLQEALQREANLYYQRRLGAIEGLGTGRDYGAADSARQDLIAALQRGAMAPGGVPTNLGGPASSPLARGYGADQARAMLARSLSPVAAQGLLRAEGAASNALQAGDARTLQMLAVPRILAQLASQDLAGESGKRAQTLNDFWSVAMPNWINQQFPVASAGSNLRNLGGALQLGGQAVSGIGGPLASMFLSGSGGGGGSVPPASSVDVNAPRPLPSYGTTPSPALGGRALA